MEKTLVEGDTLLTYLREVNKQSSSDKTGGEESGNQEGSTTNSSTGAIKSTSCAHLEGILQNVRNRYSDVDKMLAQVKTRLAQHVQFKKFEKDGLEAAQNLEQWAEELKYLDSADAVELERSNESAETWLHTQIQTANQMQVLVFELLQRGTDLIQQCDSQQQPPASPSAASAAQNSFTLNELFGTDANLSGAAGSGTNGSSCSGPSTPTAAAAAAGAATASQHTLNWLKQQNALNSNLANTANAK